MTQECHQNGTFKKKVLKIKKITIDTKISTESLKKLREKSRL